LFLATADTPKRASRPESGQAVAYDQLRGQCSSVIAQSLNLEHEFHHTASKLRVFGFEPFKQSLIAPLPPSSSVFSGFRTDCQARSRASFRLSLLLMEYPLLSRHPSPNYRLNGTLREARRSHTRDAPHSSFVARKVRRPPSQMHIFSICAPYNADHLCEFAARQMVAII